MKLEDLNESIRVNDRIQDPEVDKVWDKQFPKFKRVGKGSYQDKDGELEVWLYMYKDEDGKIQSTKYKYNKDFMEFEK